MKETVLSGNIKDISTLLNKIIEEDIIITSTVITSVKSYWNVEGTKVIKSDEGSTTILLTHKPK
jgi:hypothetical protein